MMINIFALQHTPTQLNTFSDTHSLLLQQSLSTASINGAHAFLSLTGVPITSTIATQIMKVREMLPDVWAHTGYIILASSFLSSLLAGSWMSMGEADAIESGLWSYMSRRWEECIVCVVAGSPSSKGTIGMVIAEAPPARWLGGEAAHLELMLGDVDYAGYRGRKASLISNYFVERYGLSRGVFVVLTVLIICIHISYLLQTQ